MGDAQWPAAIAYVLANEGNGYTNTPADRGGPTRFGITQASLTAWLGRHASADDVRALTPAAATAIYKARYWDALQLGQIDAPMLQTALLDMAVLAGPAAAVKRMQYCVGAKADGVLGPLTRAAIAVQATGEVVIEFGQCMQLYFCAIVRSDATQAKFLPGWLGRATRVMLLTF